jgi:hypothetical protein
MSEKRLIDVRLVRDRDGVWRAKSGDAQPSVTQARGCSSCPLNERRPFGDWCKLLNCCTSYKFDARPYDCPLRRGPAVVMLAED